MLNSNNSADSALGSIYKLYRSAFPNISHSENYLSVLMLLQSSQTYIVLIKLNFMVEG